MNPAVITIEPRTSPIRQAEVTIAVGPTLVHGTQLVPRAARGVVVVAHGDGGTRSCAPTLEVARRLADVGFATLLVDLLSAGEDRDPQRRHDVPLLAARLGQVTAWLEGRDELRRLPLTYLGVGTGAAAALMAAAFLGDRVSAVVSKDGRPDLAGPFLAHVRAPVLLLVAGEPGSPDLTTLQVNRQALTLLAGRTELVVTPTVDGPAELARRATGWLLEHATLPMA